MANKKLTFLCLVWMKKPIMTKNNQNKIKIKHEHVFQKSDQLNKSRFFLFALLIILFALHNLLFHRLSVTVFLKEFDFDNNNFISSVFFAFSSSKEHLSASLTNSDTVLSSNAFFFFLQYRYSTGRLCV